MDPAPAAAALPEPPGALTQLIGDPTAWIDAARRELAAHAGGWPRTVLAPYRICPIGAHVDHQGGPVLGMAIDAWTALAFAPRADPLLQLRSANFAGEVRLDLAGLAEAEAAPADEPAWARYARAAALALRPHLGSAPRGLTGILGGALPGAGLSSSASMLLALLRALGEANGLRLDPREWVVLSRYAENRHVGVQSGILDPAAIVGARRGALLRIDAAAKRWEPVPMGSGAPPHRFLVAYTGASRSLHGTGFNRRVEECGAAARVLAARAGGPPAHRLGDLDERAFEAHGDALPEPLRRRARHFFGECRRVEDGVAAWRAGDLARFGRLMSESCRSSIENFEVGSPELVALQALLLRTPGVLGARFSGAGFGGCCVALVAERAAAEACASLAREFGAAFPERSGGARFFVTDSRDGLQLL